MIDPQAVTNAIQQAQIPPTWRVLRAKTSYYVQGIVFWLICAVGAIVGAIALYSSNSVIGYGVQTITNPTYTTIWQIIDYGFLLAVLVVGISQTVSTFKQIGERDRVFLAILPDGFVMKLGAKPSQLVMYPFGNFTNMVTSTSNNTFALVMTLPNGRTIRQRFSGHFGAPKPVAQEILAAFAAYRTAYAMAPHQ